MTTLSENNNSSKKSPDNETGNYKKERMRELKKDRGQFFCTNVEFSVLLASPYKDVSKYRIIV